MTHTTENVTPIVGQLLPEVQRLVDRMLSFDGNFDGYPTTSCTDETLIIEAFEADSDGASSSVGYLSFLASQTAETVEQYRAARAFINAYVEHSWACNMVESGNQIHEQITAG